MDERPANRLTLDQALERMAFLFTDAAHFTAAGDAAAQELMRCAALVGSLLEEFSIAYLIMVKMLLSRWQKHEDPTVREWAEALAKTAIYNLPDHER